MHFRYRANDGTWDCDLKLEGFTDEQEYFWKATIQREMVLFLLLYPDMERTMSEE